MTGAGAATVAFVKADGFRSIPSTPTYYLPGRNPTIDELTLDNVLDRLREPQTAEAVDSLASRLDGTFAVSHVMSNDTHGDVRDIVFSDGGGGFVDTRTALSRWFVGTDYLTSGGTATVERVLEGCIPLEYSIDYNEGEPIRESLTMGYATESKATTITPSSIVGPTDGNDVPFHGAELTVDAGTVTKLQSATLSIAGISRFQRGAARAPVDATLAAPTTTLDATAIYTDDDRLERVYGGAGASEPQDTLTNVAGELTFSAAGSTVATYTLPKLKPAAYDWQDVIAADADLTDPITYHVNGGVSVA